MQVIFESRDPQAAQMRHLPVPENLRANISYKYYPSGHMVYAHEDSLRALHDDVAAFVKARGN
mgnify:CR=1 FL=1